MHIMHHIIHVSMSSSKQLHLWIRSLSKLGEPNYTTQQLFADLPKAIWWSQSGPSQAGACLTGHISPTCTSHGLAGSLSRRTQVGLALQRLFPSPGLILPTALYENRLGIPRTAISRQLQAQQRVWISSHPSHAHFGQQNRIAKERWIFGKNI